jgi:hypothetical protein
MGLSTILSDELIQAINQRGVYYLYQAKCEPRAGMVCSNWLTGEEMELEGSLYAEWKSFRCALINSGVLLQDRPDALKWTGEDLSGKISVKNVYMAMEKRNGSITFEDGGRLCGPGTAP